MHSGCRLLTGTLELRKDAWLCLARTGDLLTSQAAKQPSRARFEPRKTTRFGFEDEIIVASGPSITGTRGSQCWALDFFRWAFSRL